MDCRLAIRPWTMDYQGPSIYTTLWSNIIDGRSLQVLLRLIPPVGSIDTYLSKALICATNEIFLQAAMRVVKEELAARKR